MTATVWMPGPLEVRILLTAQDTGGAFTMLADFPGPGWALPPHSHANESETIYVVDGSFEMVVGGDTIGLGPGDHVHVPKGVVHSGTATGDRPGHRLLVFSPAGMEGFFLAAGATERDADPDLEKLVRLAGEHGWSFGA